MIRYIIVRIIFIFAAIAGMTAVSSGKVLCLSESHTAIEHPEKSAQDCTFGCGPCIDIPFSPESLISQEKSRTYKKYNKNEYATSEYLSFRRNSQLREASHIFVLSALKDIHITPFSFDSIRTVVLLN